MRRGCIDAVSGHASLRKERIVLKYLTMSRHQQLLWEAALVTDVQ